MQSIVLNTPDTFYYTGIAIGHTLGWIMGILFLVVWIWVMFKYLSTSDLND